MGVLPRDSLKEKTIKSGFWMSAIRIVSRSFSFIRSIILARFLAPNAFGLMSIAVLSTSILQQFSKVGFQSAIIQKKGKSKEYLDTAFVVRALRGTGIFLVLYLTAPFIASFFSNQAAVPVIRTLGITAILQGFTNIGMLYFRKDLEFHKKFVYNATTTLTSFCVAVFLVIRWGNVWAIVFSSIASSAVGFILSYFLHPYRPKLKFEVEKAKEMWGFGRWLTGISILLLIGTQGDDILVGRLFSTVSLGLYTIAYKLSTLPASEIHKILGPVTFPAYSKLQGSPKKLKKSILDTIDFGTLLVFPISVGLFIMAPEFIKIILGEAWISIILPVRILCVHTLLAISTVTLGALYKALGKPKILFKIQLIRVCTQFLLIFIFLSWIQTGFLGVAMAMATVSLIYQPIQLYYLMKLTSTTFKQYFRTMMPQIIASSVMGFSVFFLKTYLLTQVSLLPFIGLVASGILIYLAIIFTNKEKLTLIKSFLNQFRRK